MEKKHKGALAELTATTWLLRELNDVPQTSQLALSPPRNFGVFT